MNQAKIDKLTESVKSGDTDFQSVEELKDIITIVESYSEIDSAIDEENDINVILSALSSILEFDDNELKALDAYIDYESFGRDIRLNSQGVFSNYGWFEWL